MPRHTTSHCSQSTRAVLILLLWLAATGCAQDPADRDPGDLVVLTRNAATTYYTDRDGELAGPEYEMASAFAKSVNRQVHFEVLDSIDEIVRALEEGRGDVAAAGLTRTVAREQRFVTGPPYQAVEETVVCRSGIVLQDVTELPGLEIGIIANSSYEETLTELRERVPELRWNAITDEATEQVLRRVAEGDLDCTVADSNILAIHQRYLPELKTALTLGTEKELVWLLPAGSERLVELLDAWFENYRASGELAVLMNRYYGHLNQFDPYDVRVFARRVDSRLPQYRNFFEQAAEETGLEWTLLAAQAYQESHWEPEAISPTGVRGIMMLTRPTAASLGVENRLDPSASILGGARYLSQRLERIPLHVSVQDRLWMALAAYNIGQSHLRDARMLAVMLGENPNTWTGVKEVLPRLSQGRYHQQLPAGYARGLEAVIYIERIRNYHDLLLELVK